MTPSCLLGAAALVPLKRSAQTALSKQMCCQEHQIALSLLERTGDFTPWILRGFDHGPALARLGRPASTPCPVNPILMLTHHA